VSDAFRIYCPHDKLSDWIPTIKHHSEVSKVTRDILRNLRSARRVEQLRSKPSIERDVPLENIILFFRDSLTLLKMKRAVRRGDVGTVLNVVTF
jgi:hypothetical protein